MTSEIWAAVGVGVAVGLVAISGLLKLFYWKGTVDTSLSGVKDTLSEIKTDIGKIFDLFMQSGVTSSNSPISLNDLGRTISEELNARKWAEDKTGNLVELLRDEQPYTIQSMCFDFAGEDSNYNPILTTNMQMNAYNHGLDIGQVRRVFGIELRDAVLAKLGLQAPV